MTEFENLERKLAPGGAHSWARWMEADKAKSCLRVMILASRHRYNVERSVRGLFPITDWENMTT